ncbi:MAG: phosphate propanoyltransferase [Christensenella sp.]
MNRLEMRQKIQYEILKRLRKQTGCCYVPVAASGRHVHLSRKDVDILFGKGYCLHILRPLSQPNQFAAQETVTICGLKGKLENVRVLGPEREQTQVEISLTDSFKIGVKPIVRMSGEIDGTPGIELIGVAGNVALAQGTIISARHLHLSEEQVKWLGLKNGEIVSLKSDGQRAVVYENVIVRSGVGHEMEFHLDTDEANAAGLKNGDLLKLI